jgi:hypothetical protein
MDAQGNIYRAPQEEIPAEDKARLDGYLQAKAEAGEQARVLAELERLSQPPEPNLRNS